jgi:hypothetical protein
MLIYNYIVLVYAYKTLAQFETSQRLCQDQSSWAKRKHHARKPRGNWNKSTDEVHIQINLAYVGF